ncbi:hypothetical protein, partial [Niastella yeongjuensis]
FTQSILYSLVKRAKDSLFVTTYLATMDNSVGGVFSISVNFDTSFTKTVDMLYSDIKQCHSYRPYSKEILTGDDFFVTFYASNKLQIFGRKKASQDQLAKVNFIVKQLNIYALIPYSGYGKRLKYLKIENWNELLKYLKSGSVGSISE